MSLFTIIFAIIFYLSLRFLVVISWYQPSTNEQKPSGTTQFLLFLPLISLFVMGFLIMKWYYFLPLFIIFLMDPIMQFFPRLYFERIKEWSVKIVDNNFIALMGFYYVATITLWINFYYNF